MLPDAARQLADGLPHGALRAADDLVGQRLQPLEAELVHELQQPLAADGTAGDLGVKIAEDHLRQARVLADQRDERLVGTAGVVELQDGNLQAFLVDLARLRRQHVAADVGGVAGRRKEGDAPVAAEDRRADRHVVEVAGRLPRIVGDQHVAGRQPRRRIGGQEVLHRQRHRVDVTGRAGDGLGHHEAPRIEHAGREIAGLAHDRGERGALQRGRLLVDDADQPVPADLQRDGIEGHHPSSTTSVRRSSTRQRAPGPTTAVDSRSSTMAGPASVVPGPSA